MKITVIEPSGQLYGSEYCLLDILDGLPRESFSWNIVLPGGGGFDQVLIKRGFETYDLMPRYLHRIGRAAKLRGYWRLLRFLAKEKPDLIYLSQSGGTAESCLDHRTPAANPCCLSGTDTGRCSLAEPPKWNSTTSQGLYLQFQVHCRSDTRR